MKNLSFWIKLLFLFLILLNAKNLLSQISSNNGWNITPKGEIRILIIFAEIQYPTSSKNVGNINWVQGQLPSFANDWYDHQWTGSPAGEMTKYFSEMSFGSYKVLGDYISQIIQIDSSDVNDISSAQSLASAIIVEANSLGSLNTNSGYNFSDFDLWDDLNIEGSLKTDTGNNRYDHVMIVPRNWAESSSSTAPQVSIPEPLYSRNSDTYSIFNTQSFTIRKHEYGHLLLGNNNFHASGGHDNGDWESYLIATQCGWGIMGNGASTLKSINAWERRRLDWKGPNKVMPISCGQLQGEDSTDLDALNTAHEGSYILNDFITTGDAMRIKLPFIPGTEFEQWLWIENHQGISVFDNHEYVSCQTPFTKGLYMYVQIEKEELNGAEAFEGSADYLKFLTGAGMYDVHVSNSIDDLCDGSTQTRHIQRRTKVNPLTGYSDLQQTDYDILNDGHLSFGDREGLFIEYENGDTLAEWAWKGHERHAFHNGSGGNKKIGIATNPSSASHITLLSDENVVAIGPGDLQNNRKIYLNGISVKITNYNTTTGAITVDVQFDDIHLDQTTRWCGDSIVLPNMAAVYSSLATAGWSLELDASQILNIDRSLMPYRIDNPDTVVIGGQTEVLFNSPTTFSMEKDAKMKTYEGSTINVTNGSEFVLGDGNELDIENGRLNIMSGSTLILNSGSLLDLSGSGGEVRIDPTSKLIIRGNSSIHLNGDNSNLYIEGLVSVEDGGTFGFTGDGQISFAGTIVNDTTASWILRGNNKNDVVLDLMADATWSGGNVNFTSGSIQFIQPDLAIEITDCDNVEISEMNFTSYYYGNHFENNKALDLSNSNLNLQTSDFFGFEYGVLTKSYPDTNQVSSCFFDQCIYSITANDFGLLKVVESEINSVGNLPSGPISYYNSGVWGSRVDQIQMDLTTINKAAYGVNLDSVDGFYMRGGVIDSSDFGIRSEESLVFLRNGATIQNSVAHGAYVLAEDPLTSMITMGDSGCANIINNDIGIYGMGTTVNIDAYMHAQNSGTPSFVQFNRLDQNPYNFVEVCYDLAGGVFYPDTIHLKGIYYGSSPSANDFNTYGTTNFYPSNWSCGSPNYNIPDDFSQHSTCTPQGLCDCYSGTPPMGNGSFGGVYNKADHDYFDTVNYNVSFDPVKSSRDNLHSLVLASFQRANKDFLKKDSKETRQSFLPLASVGLYRTHKKWQAVSNRGQILNLDAESIHRIVVAKVLTQSAVDSIENAPNVFKEYFDWVDKDSETLSVEVYPIPSRDLVHVSVLGSVETLNYRILNSLGQPIQSGQIESGQNTINLAGIPAGYYHLKINNSQVETTRVVVKAVD